MHEVSIAAAIVSAVEDAVDGRAVESVDVTVGALSGVVPSALEFAWDIAVSGTSLAGSVLRIEAVPTTVHCVPCERVVQPDIGFLCPTCGQISGDVRSGRELAVRHATLLETEESLR